MLLGPWDASTLLRPPLSAATLRAADLARRAALESYPLFLRSASTPPKLLEALSPVAGWRAAEHARAPRPGLPRLPRPTCLRRRPRTCSPAERLALLPITDKQSYIRAFNTEERCLDGRIPLRGTQIDESSGSSGIPYNWVRGAAELRDKQGEMSQFARYTCGKIEITINAFSMGAWATGVNVGEALRMNGLVKSTGPDVDKIFHTLDFFGPRYRYVITAYPPFLKLLLDEAEARGFDWSKFRIHGIVAGEGMSEGLQSVPGATVPLRLVRLRRLGPRHRRGRRIAALGLDPQARRRRPCPPARPLRRRSSPADAVPVQPARLRHRDERAGRADHHHQPPGAPLAAHPLQHPRCRRRHPLRADAASAAPARPRPVA